MPKQFGDSQRTDAEQFQLQLSAEARELLDGTELGQGQQPIVEAFLRQRLFQEAWWSSDVRDGQEQILRVAAQTEVTREMMTEAIGDVTDPARFEMHMFLNALAASEGDIDMCLEAYENRRRWEAANKEIKLTEQAVAPYRRPLSIMFCELFDQAMEGEEDAKVLLRMLMPDFGNMPGAANYKSWLQRKMLNAIARATDDLTMILFEARLRKEPGLFDQILEKLLNGEDFNEDLTSPRPIGLLG